VALAAALVTVAQPVILADLGQQPKDMTAEAMAEPLAATLVKMAQAVVALAALANLSHKHLRQRVTV
jgi:hypothetical protein